MNHFNEDEILSISLEIGAAMVECGGEISRSEDTVYRINKALGAKFVQVWALPSMLAATVTAKSGKIITQTRCIGEEEINLAELDRLNQLSRRICNGDTVYFSITKNREYKPITDIIFTFLATASFCIYFGGTVTDAFFSGIIGILISNYRGPITSSFAGILLDAALAGLLSFMPGLFGINANADNIIIGTIMLLVPGLTVGNAMRDMISGDIYAGLLRLTNAILCALAIALGFSFAVLIFGSE